MRNKQRPFVVAASLAAGLLGGCQSIDQHNRVQDWPELKIVEYQVSTAELWERCQRYVPRFSLPAGCTLFYFGRGEAHIYVGEETNPLTLRHERLHAQGYDHVGSTKMLRALQAWKASQPAGVGPTLDPTPTGAGRAHSLTF